MKIMPRVGDFPRFLYMLSLTNTAARGGGRIIERMRRLSRMDGRELAVRIGQEVAKRSDLALCRLGVDLGPATVTRPRSTPKFFFSSEDLPATAAVLREALPDQAEATVAYARRLLNHRVDLLGWRGVDCGPVIDWSRDPVHGRRAPDEPWYRIPFLDFAAVGDHKVVWELNRHQHLVALARAWCLTGDTAFATEALRQWQDWQMNNPYPIGINWASSLEVALRSLSWIWLDRLLDSCPVRPPDFDAVLARALALSGRHVERYISTYFAPNTHLLGEGVALFFIGLLYPQLRPAARWRDRGWQIVLQQARAQVYPDGMHFEQATYYHVYALDFLLHARILAARNGIAVPRELDACIERMLDALCGLAQAGALPRFGDDDGGRLFDPRRNRPEHMIDPLATGAVVYDRADFKAAAGALREETLWLCGPDDARRFLGMAPRAAPPQAIRLDSSGIYAMSAAGPPRRQLFVDAGPQGVMSSGHGHADALSVQLAIGGRMWFIDPGTCRYVAENGERARFRNTAAHNTLEVDGVGQAAPSGPFSWRSTPAVRLLHWSDADTFGLFCGEHDGYSRLPAPVVHRRWVVGLDDGVWLVRDQALGTGTHDLVLSWHLAPFLDVRATSRSITRLEDDGEVLLLITPEQDGWVRTLTEGEWSPAYGVVEPAPLLRFSSRSALPTETALLLLPAARESAPRKGGLSYAASACGGCTAYRYRAGDSDRWMFFRDRPGRWAFGDWSSDALFLYAELERGKLRRLECVEGSYAEHGGRSIVNCGLART